MSIQQRVEQNQKVRISMNQKHLTVRPGDMQLVQLQNGQYRELPVSDITFHREGDNNESPWTRWYDLENPQDKEAIDLLRELLDKNPHLAHDVNFRIRIVGEFEGHGEPWPGYDDQDAEQIVAYYKAAPARVRPSLEVMMQYELGKVDADGNDATDYAKVTAIESLDKKQELDAKNKASAGVKM